MTRCAAGDTANDGADGWRTPGRVLMEPGGVLKEPVWQMGTLRLVSMGGGANGFAKLVRSGVQAASRGSAALSTRSVKSRCVVSDRLIGAALRRRTCGDRVAAPFRIGQQPSRTDGLAAAAGGNPGVLQAYLCGVVVWRGTAQH